MTTKPRSRSWETKPRLIASAYRPSALPWVVHELQDLLGSSASFALQRGYRVTATIFEDAVQQRAEMVCDALNRLEDLAVERSGEQADGALINAVEPAAECL